MTRTRAAMRLVVLAAASALRGGPPRRARRIVCRAKPGTRRAALAAFSLTTIPSAARADIGPDSNYDLWPALPVAPYSRRKTIRRQIKDDVWVFDQIIGIYYVHVPIRMTVLRGENGLMVYAPVAPTKECLSLLEELIQQYGPVQTIILPSVAVEHKVLAGPFARKFPDATFYVVDQQYSFPVPLPSRFLGLPRWARPLPRSGSVAGGFAHEVLTVKPGPGSYFQDVALYHVKSKTLCVCDAVLAVTAEPPQILVAEPEYRRALLFHARDEPLELVEDTPEMRRKGWRRIVLLFNFFIPGSVQADIGLNPLKALRPYEYGWGGWQPFAWNAEDEERSFEQYSNKGKLALLPIIQIILNRGVADGSLKTWVDRVCGWDFDTVVPAHLDAPIKASPKDFREPFQFYKSGSNDVRFCDEDVALLREAERGPLKFSVTPTSYGPLVGKKCDLGGGRPRVVPFNWTPH
ncbi:unnamed protein product [Pelagomonas calceolata]|uniref:DUF4336 domain-containing protein n=3 Tax=Pelagomonas calceolata TaxID=35677 RepID=A0A8J2X402_9STRA|nr:unnamed protein product [Pelagomonas calceolata]